MVFGRKLLSAAFVTALFVAGTLPMQARDKCEQRIQKAEAKLHNAERKHGEHSRQAEKARRDLEDARARCHR
jgi:hypothetical protein